MKRGDETRERLLAIIQGEPGINKMDLCEKTGLAWGTVFRHIKLLEERGELEVRRAGREAQLFPATVPLEQRRWLAVLRDDDASALFSAVRERGEARTHELAGELDMSRKVVRRYLRMLCRAGLLRQSGDYHPRYEPVDVDGIEEPDVS